MELLGLAAANKWTAVVAICWLLKEIIPFFFRKNPDTLSQTTVQGENNMQKIDVVMSVPKESKEVIDALTALVADIKAKKSIAEISSGALGNVVKAVEGFDQVDDEVKSDGKDEIMGYASMEIVKALGI
jgi:hypothetical protein